jgi:hypothetical protein
MKVSKNLRNYGKIMNLINRARDIIEFEDNAEYVRKIGFDISETFDMYVRELMRSGSITRYGPLVDIAKNNLDLMKRTSAVKLGEIAA